MQEAGRGKKVTSGKSWGLKGHKGEAWGGVGSGEVGHGADLRPLTRREAREVGDSMQVSLQYAEAMSLTGALGQAQERTRKLSTSAEG